MSEIDGSAIIGIHKTKVPEVASLVDIRHARTGHLHQDLRQTIQHPIQRRLFAEISGNHSETDCRGRVQERLEKTDYRSLMSGVGQGPARVHHRFANCLDDVGFQARPELRHRLSFQGPSAKQGLVQKVFFVAVRNFLRLD